jgi:IMP dehydrogenase
MPFVGRRRTARRAYGFDDIALAPGAATIDPEDVDIGWSVGDLRFDLPFLAAAMDSVVDARTAILMGELGAAAVLNLEGLQTRYEDPEEVLEAIAAATSEEVVTRLQEVYRSPIREELVGTRIAAIKNGGAPCIVSMTPQKADRLASLAEEAGADAVLIQSTVATDRHRSRRGEVLSIREITHRLGIPVMTGNCATYEGALDLLEAGAAAIFVGVGPGAACTSRRVLGIGVPQATAIIDAAAARTDYRRRTGRYVPVIADGGISVGGEVAKAIACGADAVMLGSALARAEEAPGRGYHWGMATGHAALPRGTRIRVGTSTTLRQILTGPGVVDDGSQNLAGALRTALGICGAATIPEMHETEIILAPAIATEGKRLQFAQQVGQGR